MSLTAEAKAIVDEYGDDPVPMGVLKKRAKDIKVNHALGLELWGTGKYFVQMLGALILDKKQIDLATIEGFADELVDRDDFEMNRLSEWLLANQLMKDKRLSALIDEWEKHENAVLRRLFWYKQARLRWTGQTPPDNTGYLMDQIEANFMDEVPMVQWSMNFCAGQIGIFDAPFRDRCIKLGEKTEYMIDEKVPANCVPSYLPLFIAHGVSKQAA